MRTLAERLKSARTASGLTQAQLAAVSGVSQQLISRIEKGKVGATSQILELARACNVSPEWLADETGPQARPAPSTGAETSALPVPGAVRVEATEIPIVGTTQAGPDVLWFELGYPPGFGEGFVEMAAPHRSCYALRVVGDSMAPVIQEGQAVVCDPEADPMPGEEVVVRLRDGQVMVKVFLSSQNGRVTLDSVNQQYRRLVIEADDVMLLHPVIAVVRPSAVRWK